MKLQRHVSAVMAALVLTGMSYSAIATEVNATSDKSRAIARLNNGGPSTNAT